MHSKEWLEGYRAGYNDHARGQAFAYAVYGIGNGGKKMSDALFEMDEPSHDETKVTHACTGAFCQVCNPGLALKERGMKQALKPDVLAAWKDEFRAYIQSMPQDSEFTSEDVVDAVGLPSGDVRMNANNAVGAMMNGLARKGVIAKTGLHVQSKRPSSHGAELILWVRRASDRTKEVDARSRSDVPVPAAGPNGGRTTATVYHTCHPSGLYYDPLCAACRIEAGS